jgi:hypothetical protein
LFWTKTRLAVGLLGALAALASSLGVSSLGQDNVPLKWDGYLILRIRTDSGGLTAQQRAEAIQLRLQNLMEQQFAHEQEDIIGRIGVRRFGNEMVIGTPDHLIMTVTWADARACNSSVFWLAHYWRARLVEALIIATRTG